MDVKFFVFASSVAHKGRIDFNAMADVRTRELITLLWKTRKRSDALLKLPAILRFLHFDTTNGEVWVFEQTLDPKSSDPAFRGKKKLPWVSLGAFTATAGPPEADPKNFVDLPSNARAIDQDLDFGGPNERAFNPAPGRDVSGILSITNVYHTVRGAPRKSVLELAMFGHGFLEGPVLINSFEDSPLPAPFQPADKLPDGTPRFPRRSDNDKDGRIRTDFHENMGEDPAVASPTPTGGATRNIRSGGKGALTEFAGAFDDNATYRTCGCDIQDVAVTREFIISTAYQVIHQAYVLPTTKNSQGKARRDLLRSGGSSSSTTPVPANTPVTLDFSGEFADEIDAEKDENARDVAAGLPPSPVHTKDELRTLHQGTDSAFLVFSGFTVSTTWGDLIKYVARHTINTYAFAAADAVIGAGVSTFKCLAAPPGISSQNENGRVQRICRSNGEDSCGSARPFKPYIEFYEKFLDLSSKEPWPASIQRNYGVFDKDSVAAIKVHKDQG